MAVKGFVMESVNGPKNYKQLAININNYLKDNLPNAVN